MHAAVVRRFGQAPRYETFSLPADAAGTRVEVLAAALSPRTRSGASGEHYASEGTLPRVPGIDGVGRLPSGERVYFLAAHDALGAMAEQALADARLVVPLPEPVGAATIAAGMLPAISSWVALTQRAPLQAGQRVLVLGATGTSGLLAVQIARRLGAGEVLAAGRDASSLARAAALGAAQTFQLRDAEGLDALADAAREVDVVLDYLWGSATSALLPALCRRRESSRALRWVSIGSAAGGELALSSTLLRKRNLHLLGSGQGASSTAEMFAATGDIVAAFAAGELTVAVQTAPLAEVEARWNARVPSGERLVFLPRAS